MIILYCPFPDEKSALHFARILLEKKYIVCAQVISPMKSLYEWEGEIKIEVEYLLLLKTKKNMFDIIESELEEHHPYQIPCLLELAVNRVNPPYLKWLNSNIVSTQ